MPALAALGRAGAAVLWYVREVLGENDYAKHVAHLARVHPGATPPTRRQFERERMDRLEAAGATRCC